MKEEEKKPHGCLHCALVAAIQAHGTANPDACHCECCLTMALAEVIRDVLGEVPTGNCGAGSTAKH